MLGFLTGVLGTVWTGWSTLDWLVDAEHKLQMLDGARLSILTGLSVLFFFNSSLSDHVSGVVPLEVGCLELLDAPGEEERNGKGQGFKSQDA